MNKLWTNLKSWYGVLFLVLLAGGVLWSVLNGLPYINNLRAKWEAQRLQNQWEKPYREDKYGGKTPEETYDLFLDALRKGDTTLASKYFVIEKQDDWNKTLNEYQKKNKLIDFINELENTKKIWIKTKSSSNTLFKDIISYEYKVLVTKDTTVDFEGKTLNVPAGNYTNETTFELNTFSKIWKIHDL